MPPAIVTELKRLEKSPRENASRLLEIYTDYRELIFTAPTDADNLVVQALLSAATIPFTVLLGLLMARRIARPLSDVAAAAESVSLGSFSARASTPSTGPVELQGLVTHFNAMAQQLEAYDRELHDSSAAIAHELRTPLTAAMGRLQGIVDGVFPLKEEQVSAVLAQMEQIRKIIGDLQVLSLAQGGRLDLDVTEFSMRELVDERLSWAEPAIRARNMQAFNHVSSEQRLHADRARMGQALSALLDNAVRYASEGGVVEIKFDRGDSEAQLRVQDRGKGMPTEELSQIFQRFWRGENSRAQHSRGSGLGLSVVQAICTAHGGYADAMARPGGGTEIRLFLPAEIPRG
ncbi:Signal transduction histidine-protein kinase BaeS [Variovorax boronicumulans]|nr:Signal transduction histidine-protein kinase BaeS [Variovorax boronicumulans]